MLLIIETCLYLPLLFIPLSSVRSLSCLTCVKLLSHWVHSRGRNKVLGKEKRKRWTRRRQMWNVLQISRSEGEWCRDWDEFRGGCCSGYFWSHCTQCTERNVTYKNNDMYSTTNTERPVQTQYSQRSLSASIISATRWSYKLYYTTFDHHVV